MAFTQEQHDKLEAAIAQGVLKVEYADKKVTYQSRNDMIATLKMMKRDLGLLDDDNGGMRLASFSKGIHPNSDFNKWID